MNITIAAPSCANGDVVHGGAVVQARDAFQEGRELEHSHIEQKKEITDP